MFDKFQQLKQMRDLQQSIAKTAVCVEKNGVSLSMNGQFELQELSLNPELSVLAQEQTIKDLFKEARKKIQTQLASQLGGMM